MEKIEMRSLREEDLIEKIQSLGEKKFRGRQIYEWLHKKSASDFDQMSNVPKELRELLKAHFYIAKVEKAEEYSSEKDGTKKYLFSLEDDQVVESVWMKYKHGNSVCISSQVGCRMGCRFCASTLGGLERNLLASEMLGQIYEIQKLTKERVSNVVVMGTGEPLDNYENLLTFIHLLTNEQGLHISQRNITVSTCGLAEQIKRLAQEQMQITLAISLHAPNDVVRRQLMPVANRYSIEEILSACKDYYEMTKRRITFEYSLVKGVNDKAEHARELSSRLKGLCCHVNLIPVNPIKERDFEKTETRLIQNFKNILEKNRINVTIRREMGADIDAACGQLRKRYADHRKKEERQ